MADEARIIASLTITADQVSYSSRPTSFTADVTGRKGPTPGAVKARMTGTIVEFSELTIPGFCKIGSLNIAAGNYVEYGIYDPQIDVFYPLGEINKDENYVIRLSRNLLEEYTSTGTGTTAATNKFMVKAFNADADVTVEAFEK